MGDFWVFGYGSLMWRPGFEFLERQHAIIDGYHRALCIYSWVHRGTQSAPGLVFGLDSGGQCEGIAYRVSGEKRESVITYLRERELVTNVYLERWEPISLKNGDIVSSLVYVVDQNHQQYAGKLAPEVQLGIIRKSVGKSGANDVYVENTVAHLSESGIRDPALETLCRKLRQSTES